MTARKPEQRSSAPRDGAVTTEAPAVTSAGAPTVASTVTSANGAGARAAASEQPRPEALTQPTAATPTVAPAVGPASAVKDRTVGRRSLSGRKQRFEARKVHRIIRHVDPWSVLKLSVVFFLCVWVMFMVAIVIVWSIAESSGTIGKIEDLLAELDITNSGFDGTFIFRQYGLFGLVMATACTVATTVGAIVFNLVSDLIGGIWVTVIEEETARPTAD